MEPARRAFSPRQRYVALALLAPVFLYLIPCAFVRLGAQLDQWLQWSPILAPWLSLLVGGLLVLPGLAFAWWSIYRLLTLGRGTPLPLMPTQRLIVEPPYANCRNPMALGAIGMYLGVAVLFRSLGAVVLVLVCAGALVAYIKRSEEKVMEVRFGPEYVAYRERTPFLIPRFRHRR